MRQCDIIGRIGGEEFAVFLPNTDINPALKIAEQLRCAVESIEFHPAEEQDYQLSISIGLAFSAGAHTTSQLMRMADQSLYQAKANGRNQIVINQECLISNTKSLDSMDAA